MFVTKGLGEEVSHWYAFHIFRNYRKRFIERLESDDQEYFQARQNVRSLEFNYDIKSKSCLLFPSIVFVRTTPEYVESFRSDPGAQVAPYTKPGTKEPAIINDREMEVFMFVLENGYERVDIVDEKLARGDRVRILDGVFKGAEGYIVRIKGDRRFVVSIHGIAAVATSYIPQKYLEKINEDTYGIQ